MSQLGGGPRVPSAKFTKVGVSYAGRVTEEPKDFQVKNYTTGELEFWADGQPKMQTRVILDLPEPDADGQDRVALYVKGRMVKAVREAVIATGAPDVEVDSWLSVTRIEDGKATKGAPPHQFEAEYRRPEGAGAPIPDEDVEDDGPPF